VVLSVLIALSLHIESESTGMDRSGSDSVHGEMVVFISKTKLRRSKGSNRSSGSFSGPDPGLEGRSEALGRTVVGL
jgi:hypothetical protein